LGLKFSPRAFSRKRKASVCPPRMFARGAPLVSFRRWRKIPFLSRARRRTVLRQKLSPQLTFLLPSNDLSHLCRQAPSDIRFPIPFFPFSLGAFLPQGNVFLRRWENGRNLNSQQRASLAKLLALAGGVNAGAVRGLRIFSHLFSVSFSEGAHRRNSSFGGGRRIEVSSLPVVLTFEESSSPRRSESVDFTADYLFAGRTAIFSPLDSGASAEPFDLPHS